MLFRMHMVLILQMAGRFQPSYCFSVVVLPNPDNRLGLKIHSAKPSGHILTGLRAAVLGGYALHGKSFHKSCSHASPLQSALCGAKSAALMRAERYDYFAVPVMLFDKRVNSHRNIAPPVGITEKKSHHSLLRLHLLLSQGAHWR